MIGLVSKIKRTGREDTHRTAKKTPTPAPAIPAPEPAGLGSEYGKLWNAAWRLADWIDDPAAAPIEARRAKLPELDRLRERMAEIERSGGTMEPAPAPELSGEWRPAPLRPAPAPGPGGEDCPARCRATGQCCGLTVFGKKSGGRVRIECTPTACPWVVAATD